MKNKKRLLPLILLCTTLPAAADTCESLISTYKQRPVAVVSPDQPATGPNANAEKSMELFAQAYDQFQRGQEEQCAALMMQAISLLENK